jgi:signal transduction histidine kinase
VRECPAKAIRISEGQAEIIPERCIACGNCVRLCSQQAKQVRNTTAEVVDLLAGDARVAACIAPSFPAAFPQIEYRRLVGMIRMLGFDYVHEVSFGADLVAHAYRRLLLDEPGRKYISTNCPAVTAFIERYHPELVENLAPIVSPMVAMARALRQIHGPEVKVVFIGPCIAKKVEAMDDNIPDEVDAASTFLGLRRLFNARGMTPEFAESSDFDPPWGSLGALFPITRGMLQASEMDEDLVAGQIVSADGRENFVEALEEFANGALDASLLDILACRGCIMGSGMTSEAPMFSRRSRVSEFVRNVVAKRDKGAWRDYMAQFAELDLSRRFAADDQRVPTPPEHEIRRILRAMGKLGQQDELNCGACGYDTCREHAIAVYKGLAEIKMCLPYTIEELNKTIQSLAVSSEQLARTQEALMQSEKLASMGQLAAGIAHELNNPLGVVLMYAHLLMEDLNTEIKVQDDLKVIADQADRCKKIVSGLLRFARQNKVLLEPTHVRELVNNSLRASVIPTNVSVHITHEMADPVVDVDHDQIVQVLTNLIVNACAAMPGGGELTIETADKNGDQFEIRVSDNGCGIPEDIKRKIFEPFFTTKSMGKGTGLGLAVAYGIIKMHRGDIQVKSNADTAAGLTGSTFTVILPRKGAETD